MKTKVQKLEGDHHLRQEGDMIIIDIPMTFRRHCGRKQIVAPPGVITPSPEPISPLALALARAFAWQELIESGQVESNSALARKLHLDQSYVARTIRLTSLSPENIASILSGQAADGLSLTLMRREIPVIWQEQKKGS